MLTGLGICRNGIAPDSYALTKADIIQLRKVTRNGGRGMLERVRRCQSVLRRSFQRCLGHLLFQEYDRCSRNMSFCLDSWLIFEFTITRQKKLKQDRCILELCFFVNFLSHIFAAAYKPFTTLEDQFLNVFCVIQNARATDSANSSA